MLGRGLHVELCKGRALLLYLGFRCCSNPLTRNSWLSGSAFAVFFRMPPWLEQLLPLQLTVLAPVPAVESTRF